LLQNTKTNDGLKKKKKMKKQKKEEEQKRRQRRRRRKRRRRRFILVPLLKIKYQTSYPLIKFPPNMKGMGHQN